MAERKPASLSWETWIDRQIREAAERGEFDDLPGAGEPLPGLDEPYDELWWVKRLLRRENLSVTPPTLEVRRERDEALRRVADAETEAEVRRIVADVNARIAEVNAKPTAGPPSRVAPLDADEVVRRWHEQHA